MKNYMQELQEVNESEAHIRSFNDGNIFWDHFTKNHMKKSNHSNRYDD